MSKKNFFFLLCLLSFSHASGQECRSLSEDIRSVRVVCNGAPLAPPLLAQGRREALTIEFDEMSHDYHRYIYHVDFCNADWTVSDELFESDYLSGLNDQPIDDYEKSFNTTQLYTHYRLVLPSSETRLRLAGNYRVTVYDDDEPSSPVLTAEFCVYSSAMSIMAQATGNTDVDFNASHQQLALSVGYGRLRVSDPTREVKVVVVQNRRTDCRVFNPRPTYQKANGLEYAHHRDLIFPAGNEFHKFELLDVRKPGLNIDHIRFLDPYYYVTLFEDSPARAYVYDEDQNGASWIRREDDVDVSTTCEYVWVNFSLRAPRGEEAVYVCGSWTNGAFDPAALMTYDEATGLYEASLYLKQGYYNYQYRTASHTLDGDFYETENEYTVFVYFRPLMGRYDELVGVRVFRTLASQL